MAQNITLMGANYSAVPAVTLPKQGGGSATFTDVTDTTADASDVASGKYFYTAAGVKTAGTNSGGVTVEQLNVTNSGTITAPTGKAYSPVVVPDSDYTLALPGGEFYTDGGQRWWRIRPKIEVDEPGWISSDSYGDYLETFALASGTTITPGTSNQTVGGANYVMEGAVTVSGDANLVAGNIKSGTTIFGVLGNYTGGGSSPLVQGTFTTGSTGGTVESVNIPYTGSGFPIAAMVFIDGGAYNNTATGNTTWYNSVQRYAVGQWTYSKSVLDSTPTYGTSGTQNQGVTTWIYKNSTSQATTYSRSSAMNTNVLTSSNATGAGATCVRFKGNSGKTLSYYVASTSYGLLANTKYKYIVIYSS